jgi:hypothetical protein
MKYHLAGTNAYLVSHETKEIHASSDFQDIELVAIPGINLSDFRDIHLICKDI